MCFLKNFSQLIANGLNTDLNFPEVKAYLNLGFWEIFLSRAVCGLVKQAKRRTQWRQNTTLSFHKSKRKSLQYIYQCLDTRVECTPRTLASDTKLVGSVDSLKGRESLQRDFDRLGWWAITNHIKFNKSKCWILHMGWWKSGYTVRVRSKRLEYSPAARDLGVFVDGKLNTSQQCVLVTRRAKCILGCIRHSATN